MWLPASRNLHLESMARAWARMRKACAGVMGAAACASCAAMEMLMTPAASSGMTKGKERVFRICASIEKANLTVTGQYPPAPLTGGQSQGLVEEMVNRNLTILIIRRMNASRPLPIRLKSLSSAQDALADENLQGGVAEWSNAAVLKTVEAQVSGGSNPSPSAIILT